MSAPATPLPLVLAADADQIARLLAAGAGDRALRQVARGALGRAFGLLSSASADDPADEEVSEFGDGAGAVDAAPKEASAAQKEAATSADMQTLLALVGECERLLRQLEGPFAGVRPLRRVQVRRPLPERLRPPRVASRLQAQGSAVVARCTPQLALSEARLDWFEARTKAESPGMIRPVRASDATREPAAGVEFELLRKKGRSPFS